MLRNRCAILCGCSLRPVGNMSTLCSLVATACMQSAVICQCVWLGVGVWPGPRWVTSPSRLVTTSGSVGETLTGRMMQFVSTKWQQLRFCPDRDAKWQNDSDSTASPLQQMSCFLTGHCVSEQKAPCAFGFFLFLSVCVFFKMFSVLSQLQTAHNESLFSSRYTNKQESITLRQRKR